MDTYGNKCEDESQCAEEEEEEEVDPRIQVRFVRRRRCSLKTQLWGSNTCLDAAGCELNSAALSTRDGGLLRTEQAAFNLVSRSHTDEAKFCCTHRLFSVNRENWRS